MPASPVALMRKHHVEPKTKMTKFEALEAAKNTGVDIDILRSRQDGDVITWSGAFGGQNKPKGPLHNQKIGVLVAAEFSDFQAYYLASYIGEHGGSCEFLLVDWVTWKNVRPNIPNKGVRGMWDLSVDPMPMMGGSNKNALYRGLKEANAQDYNAIVILGGHSADVMETEGEVIDFIKKAAASGAVLGSIGEGSMPLISAGVMNGKKCVGNQVVDYMLRKIAELQDAPVATDGNLITARDTVDTPAFMRALCAYFDHSYKDVWKGAMVGKRVLEPVGEDYEDIEVVVSVMEFIYRGAEVIIGKFDAQYTSRSPHLGHDVTVGSFGTTIPFQEIPDSYYTIQNLDDVKMSDFDVAVITGGFSPFNMVATGKATWLKKAYSAGKVIAAICHGPILVGAADLVQGKKMTGWLASKNSVEIMGGEFNTSWAAVIDGKLVSGRTPPEIPEFVDAINVALLE